jgi:DNA-binding MarR family transcriptional regulator
VMLTWLHQAVPQEAAMMTSRTSGLIERTGDPADRRRRAIALTPAGQKMLKELRQAADAVEADMLKGLDDHQQASLHRLLLTLFETTIGQ